MPKSRTSGCLGRKEHDLIHQAYVKEANAVVSGVTKYFRDETLREVRKMTDIVGQAKACAEGVLRDQEQFKYKVLDKWDDLNTRLAKAWDDQQNKLLWKLALTTVAGGLGLLLGVLTLFKAFGLLKI